MLDAEMLTSTLLTYLVSCLRWASKNCICGHLESVHAHRLNKSSGLCTCKSNLMMQLAFTYNGKFLLILIQDDITRIGQVCSPLTSSLLSVFANAAL